jgi:DNA-binding IclR family transcriptional regulator
MRGKIVPARRMYKIALGVLYSSRFRIQRQAILQKLGRQLDEACGIAIPDGTEMIYYDRVESSWPLQFNLKAGSRVPLWCTSSGKLYLSFLPQDIRHRVINNLPLDKLSRSTLTDPDSLEESLISTRANEMGIDNEEYIDGMVGCSVPIKNEDGHFIASLYTHVPVVRKSLEELMEYEPLLRQAALEISNFLNTPVIDNRDDLKQ